MLELKVYKARGLYREDTPQLASGIVGECDVVLAADAQATIADLQGVVAHLEQSLRNVLERSRKDRERAYNQGTEDATRTVRNQIADLQGQLQAAKKQVAGYDRWLSGGVYYTNAEFEEQINDRVNLRNERTALQQRVAQLEREIKDYQYIAKKAYRLQDDHARVLGLVQAAVVQIEQVEGELHAALNGTRHDPSWIRPIQLSRNERQELYLSCEAQLKAIRASMPAQPAQGGALYCHICGDRMNGRFDSEHSTCRSQARYEDDEGETRA